MKKLSLYIFLVLMWCNVGFADIGDDYLCKSLQSVEVNPESLDTRKNKTFRFKWKKNKIVYDDGAFESKIIWSKSHFFYAVTYISDTDIPVMVGYFDSGILSTIMIDKDHEHLIDISSCKTLD